MTSNGCRCRYSFITHLCRYNLLFTTLCILFLYICATFATAARTKPIASNAIIPFFLTFFCDVHHLHSFSDKFHIKRGCPAHGGDVLFGTEKAAKLGTDVQDRVGRVTDKEGDVGDEVQQLVLLAPHN